MKNNIYPIESNNRKNYYPRSDNNFNMNKEQNVMNKAKESIKTFKNQFLGLNENNMRNITTEANIINQNNQVPYYPLSEMNKEREELKDYDLYFGSGMNKNKNSPIKDKNQEEQNLNINNDYDFINQENIELRKKIMELTSQNNNLKNKINNENIDYLSNFNSIDNKPEYIVKAERDNNINDFNINNNNNNNININNNNNNKYSVNTVPFKDQKFMEESIESLLKTNFKKGTNKYQNNQRSSLERKINSVDNKNLQKFKKNNIYELNFDYNDDKYNNNIRKINVNNDDNNNEDQYLNTVNNYNQLLENYNKYKKKVENLQKELEARKINLNKLQILNNNYLDLQKRNKELTITIQKMKTDNIILTQHIEELNKQKKKNGKKYG